MIMKKILNRLMNVPSLKYQLEVNGMGQEKRLIVDLGCGDGALLRSLKSKFPRHDYVGVDIGLKTEVKEDGLRLIRGDLFDFVSTDEFRKAGMVVLNDVIEHLSQDDIVRLFSLFNERLTPGTVVFCQTPNGAGPFGLRNFSGDPTHVTLLSAAKLDSLIARSRIRCEYEVLGVEEVAPCGHPLIGYATAFLYYKIVCKVLGILFHHSIGWNRHFWEPNILLILRRLP